MVKTDKKKFLTELGKLLTFMYDEDRATALSMYLEMFEQASDEEELLRFLVSPTRQAVMLARQYNAKDRDLSVRGTAGEGDSDVALEKEPRFVRTINGISAKAEEAGIFSSYVSVWSDRKSNTGNTEDYAENYTEENTEEITEPGTTEEPENEGIPENEVILNNQEIQEGGEESGPEADTDRFYIKPSKPGMNEKAETGEEQVPDGTPSIRRKTKTKEKPDIKDDRRNTADPRAGQEPEEEPEQKEANIFRLILYILVAVPVTAVILALLLVPVVVSLALSVLLIILGVEVIATAFGGFSVFADIMVVLGVAFVLIALGFLVFRVFIWLICTVMVNVINGSIVLGERFSITGGN